MIRDISFQGSGCAISKASASMMTASVKGKTKGEAESLFDMVHRMLTGEMNTKDGLEELGKLAVLAGVYNFPARVKCASLSWNTLHAALEWEWGSSLDRVNRLGRSEV